MVFVCRECKGHRRLEKYLDTKTEAEVKRVGCQKVCDEPAAGLRVGGRMEWFGRLDGKQRLAALARLVAGEGTIPKVLDKVRSAKQSGRSPR